MVSNTFYLKYRPQTIDDLDIDSVRDSLNNIVKSGQIPHALLFSGVRGTGKTSAARVMAKIINCESKDAPCNKCDHCKAITNGTDIDVIEMDAASNRGIDDVRALRDVVKLSPANSKAKVYIIDEAHMLTTEASNALLKTLEEPPAHVYFILATTNPEKLIDTIRSRTTIITFTKATVSETKRALKRIVDGEKIKIDDQQIDKIIKLAKGSFRDAVKTLEQFSKDSSFLDSISTFEPQSLVEKILTKDLNMSLDLLSGALSTGVSVENVTLSILELLQEKILDVSNSLQKKDLIQLIELILSSQEYLKYSPIEELPLQIAIVKWCSDIHSEDDKNTGSGNSNSDETKKLEVKKTENITNEKQIETKQDGQKIEEKTQPDLKKKSEEIKDEAKVIDFGEMKELSKEEWNKLLLEVRPINASIEGLLRSTKPIGFDGRNLKISVNYKFHKDKLEEAKNKKLIEEIAEKVFQNQVRIECLISNEPIEISQDNTVLTEVKNDNILNVAESIFG